MGSYFRRSGGQAFGLEIGTSAIKVVALRAGSPPSLQHAVMVPTPIGSMRDGLVVEPQAVATELRNLLAEHHITTRYAVTAVPNQSAVTRMSNSRFVSIHFVGAADSERAVDFRVHYFNAYIVERALSPRVVASASQEAGPV